MKTLRITNEMLALCQSDDDVWSIGNEVLYTMCRQYPKHEIVAEIVANQGIAGRGRVAFIKNEVKRGEDSIQPLGEQRGWWCLKRDAGIANLSLGSDKPLRHCRQRC